MKIKAGDRFWYCGKTELKVLHNYFGLPGNIYNNLFESPYTVPKIKVTSFESELIKELLCYNG